MKLCNFYEGNEVHVGAMSERGLVDLTKAGLPADMNALIAGADSALSRIAALCADDKTPVKEAPVSYANVTVPSKIVCVGLNYKSHAEETGGTAPEQPVIFSKFSDSICPDGTEVTLPGWLRCFDYEAELVIVIGKPVWNTSPEEAANCIFGYTCGNDLSARDAQFTSKQWLIGKTLPNFAPAGPLIVTADSFDPADSHAIQCRLNGELVQDGNTNDMIFSCPEIVSYCSRYFTLHPGDLIFTGTPAGVILGKPKGTRVWLTPGSELEVTIEGIGSLKNKLI